MFPDSITLTEAKAINKRKFLCEWQTSVYRVDNVWIEELRTVGDDDKKYGGDITEWKTGLKLFKTSGNLLITSRGRDGQLVDIVNVYADPLEENEDGDYVTDNGKVVPATLIQNLFQQLVADGATDEQAYQMINGMTETELLSLVITPRW